MVGKVKKDLNNHYQLLENAIKLTCSSFHSITPWHSFINTLQHPLRCIEGKPWTWVNTSNKCLRESHIKPLRSKLDANMYHVLLTTRWLVCCLCYLSTKQRRQDLHLSHGYKITQRHIQTITLRRTQLLHEQPCTSMNKRYRASEVLAREVVRLRSCCQNIFILFEIQQVFAMGIIF